MAGLQIFDIIVIVLVIIMTFRGGLSGIIIQLASIFAIGLGWFVSDRFHTSLEPVLSQLGTLSKPISIVILFVGTILAVKIVARFIRSAFAATPLKEFDRQMGALLGFIKGIIFCMILTYFAVVGNVKTREAVFVSQSGKYFVQSLQIFEKAIPDDVRHAFLKNGFAQFDELVKDTPADETQNSDDNSINKEVDILKNKLEKDFAPGSDFITNIKSWTQGPNETNNTIPQTNTPGTSTPGTNTSGKKTTDSSQNSIMLNSFFEGISKLFGTQNSTAESSSPQTRQSTVAAMPVTQSSNTKQSSNTIKSSNTKQTLNTTSTSSINDLAIQIAHNFQNASQQLSDGTTQNKSPVAVPTPQNSSGSNNTLPSYQRAYTSSILDQPVLPPNQVAPSF